MKTQYGPITQSDVLAVRDVYQSSVVTRAMQARVQPVLRKLEAMLAPCECGHSKDDHVAVFSGDTNSTECTMCSCTTYP